MTLIIAATIMLEDNRLEAPEKRCQWQYLGELAMLAAAEQAFIADTEITNDNLFSGI